MTSRPLIVRLRNWVGDVILGVPALKLLTSHGYQLHLVGKGWAPALLAGEDWPVHVRPAGTGDSVRQLRELRRAAQMVDPAFDRRVNARGFLLARSVPISYGGSALVSYWELACRLLGITQPPPPEIGLKVAGADVERADALLRTHGVAPGFIVICPFAGGTFEKLDKSWPLFPQFARALLATGRQVVACPGPGEEQTLREQYPGVIALDGVKLGPYAAIIRRSELLVSNDTGPGHLAAAVGARVLSVLGPTKAQQWAPWGPTVTVVQRPQSPGHIEWPDVDEVMQRVTALAATS
jgi:heptosyltransferase-2